MATITGEASPVSEMLVEYATTRDQGLRNQLAVRHLPLVKFVARKMSANLPENVELDDLVSWGSIGLLDALEKFEPHRGWQFSTYAVQRIRGEILDGLQRMEWAPKQVVAQVRRHKHALADLQQELGRQPTNEEVAEKLGITEAQSLGIRLDMRATRVQSLDGAGSRGDAEDSDVAEITIPDDPAQEVAGEVVEIRRRMADALVQLDAHEARILFLYYEQNRTLREIALELGISVSSATQAHTRLVDRVRNRLTELHGAVA